MVHYLNNRDFHRRKKIIKREFFYSLAKMCIVDKRLNYETRFLFKNRILQRNLRLQKYSITFLRRRCKETGRSRFVLRAFGLSRATFKSRASKGLFSGFQKR
jgi:ribosomal protein S14